MAMLARNFAHPRGIVGRVAGRMMARGNATFNTWVVEQVSQPPMDDAKRIAEIGPGPGVGLQAVLRSFPQASVWGVDQSPEMLSQARARNREHVSSGRLKLLAGDVRALRQLAPIDLALAVHVLYFWHQPVDDLAQIRTVLRPGGWLALGYQLRQNMPGPAQRNFPKEGHLLYESDDAVSALLTAAGFKSVGVHIKGPAGAPQGRLALATA